MLMKINYFNSSIKDFSENSYPVRILHKALELPIVQNIAHVKPKFTRAVSTNSIVEWSTGHEHERHSIKHIKSISYSHT
jgi:hypothetical protein